MKLPNGYGSVYKLSGKRRNPWVARKTIGWRTSDEKKSAQPVYKFVGYFRTRQEAMQALAEYNRLSDGKDKERTFREVYEEWSTRTYPTYSVSNRKAMENAFNLYSKLHDTYYSDIDFTMLQDLFDSCGKGYSTIALMKNLFRKVTEYAILSDYADPKLLTAINQVVVTTKKQHKTDRKVFSDREIKALWESSDRMAKIILILIYTGMRSGELMELKVEDVHLESDYIEIKKSKTESGIRRIPIASKIKPILEVFLAHPIKYAITTENGLKYDHSAFRREFDAALDILQTEHTPHDTRHTCISRMVTAGVDARVVKQIVGHKTGDVTEDVYTHIDMARLRDAIEKV